MPGGARLEEKEQEVPTTLSQGTESFASLTVLDQDERGIEPVDLAAVGGNGQIKRMKEEKAGGMTRGHAYRPMSSRYSKLWSQRLLLESV